MTLCTVDFRLGSLARRNRNRLWGNIVDHEYEFERGGEKVAQVTKRWFRVRDTYGIQIAPGQDDSLILAATVCVEQMAEER
jgi:uncharacterized protein YxjI